MAERSKTLRRFPKDEPAPAVKEPKPYTNGVTHKQPAFSMETAVKTEPEPEETLSMAMSRPDPKEWDESGDFAAMLEESAPIQKLNLSVGSRVKARLIYISKDTAFFALGQKHEGAMTLADLMDANGNVQAKIGDVVDAYVVSIGETIHLSKKLSRFSADMSMLEDAKANRIPVEGKITSVNTGGVEVSLAGTRGFCPIGQVDINYIEDAASLVGKTYSFLVTQISGGGKNIVLSRRALLERERNENTKKLLSTLKVGEQVTGTISRTAEFGAFVDLGGVEGLIPMSELGFGHFSSVEERIKVGEQVTVEVLRIEPDPKKSGQFRIALSLKATLPSPYEAYGSSLVAGTSLPGKVSKLESFGAFVELFPGIDGLIHISELSNKRVKHPGDVLKLGDMITVRILNVDFEKKRIALSLRDPVVHEVKEEVVEKIEIPHTKSLGTLGDLFKKRSK